MEEGRERERERDVDGCWLQESASSMCAVCKPVVQVWCPLKCGGGVCAQCVCVCSRVQYRVQCVCGVVGAKQRWSMCVVLCCVSVCSASESVVVCSVSVCWHVIFELE